MVNMFGFDEGAEAFVTNDEKLKQAEKIKIIVMKHALGKQ